MHYSRDLDYCRTVRAEVRQLEDYFCARNWVSHALCQHHLSVVQWLTTSRVPSPFCRLKIQKLLALARDIEPFAPSKAQVGWWLCCRHFRLGRILCSFPAGALQNKSVDSGELVDLARDDFLDGSRLHRLETPSPLAIPDNRWAQIHDRPWYLLDLPDRPTLADKRLERTPVEIESSVLNELLGGP